MWLAATNGLALGSGLGTHCNRKRRLNAAVLQARLLLSPHSSHLDSAPGVSGSPVAVAQAMRYAGCPNRRSLGVSDVFSYTS